MLILFFVRDEKVRQSCCVWIAALLATVLANVGSILLRSKPDCSTLTEGCHLVSKSGTHCKALCSPKHGKTSPISASITSQCVVRSCGLRKSVEVKVLMWDVDCVVLSGKNYYDFPICHWFLTVKQGLTVFCEISNFPYSGNFRHNSTGDKQKERLKTHLGEFAKEVKNDYDHNS
ncbi:hypothetical protein TNCV_4013351 [Trichonephila clavipes]|nr:hypothetical protein TNCV_4013351 [Trichonephila clavipes]